VLAGGRTYNGGDGEQQVREIDQFLSILQLLFLIVQEYQALHEDNDVVLSHQQGRTEEGATRVDIIGSFPDP